MDNSNSIGSLSHQASPYRERMWQAGAHQRRDMKELREHLRFCASSRSSLRLILLLPPTGAILPMADPVFVFPPAGGVRNGFSLLLNGKWPPLRAHYISYTSTSPKDGCNLTKQQKVDAVCCALSKGHLGEPRAYRHIRDLGTGAMESPGKGPEHTICGPLPNQE